MDYEADPGTTMERRLRGGAAGTIATVVMVFALFIGVLFTGGLQSVDAKSGASTPAVKVKVTGAPLPAVHVQLKPATVETAKATGDAPVAIAR